MSATYGLTDAGYVIKDLPTIVGELQGKYQGIFGKGIPLSDPSAYSSPNFTGISIYDQLIGIHAERESDLWELGQSVYLSQYPDTASGAALANAGQLTGQTPESATYSTVTETINGTAGTTVPSGFQVSISGTSTTFQTTASYTIPSGGSLNVTMQATVTGPQTAPAGTLTNIVTPVAGITSVTNSAAATVGQAQETDAAFRARRAANLVTATGGSIAAMQNYIKAKVPGTTFVGIQQNATNATVGSLPPHSYHVTIITSGTNAQIAQAIWDCHAAGMATSGATSASATDSFGNAQTVNWDTGVNVPLYMSVTINRDAQNYPSNGDSLVQTALINYVTGLGYGAVIQDWLLQAQLGGIAGIDSAPTILFDRSPNPTGSATLTLAANEKPTLIASNIAMH